MSRWAALVLVTVFAREALADKPPCAGEEPYQSDLEPRGAETVLGGTQSRGHVAGVPIDLDRCHGVLFPFEVSMRVEGVSSFVVDRDRVVYGPRALYAPRARGGALYSTGEAIAPTKVDVGIEIEMVPPLLEEAGLAGIGYPGEDPRPFMLRRAGFRFAFSEAIQLGAGWSTSHWGLGLIANDGNHGWEPGSARFSDPRAGDNPLRLFFGTGPLTDAKLRMSIAGDFLDHALLTDDDILYDGDTASQAIASITVGDDLNKPLAAENTCGEASCGVGIYGALRRQDGFHDKETRVVVLDMAGHARFPFGQSRIGVSFEVAGIGGETELAPTAVFQSRRVWQLGAALRMSVDRPRFGAVVDFLYASGDRNQDDAELNAFKADPNYEVGLLLFRHVLAAQTARAAFRVADPALVGQAPRDRELLPTYGSATNAIVMFPRLRVRPIDGLEVYGGPLVALAPQPVADPLETRAAGGVPRTMLGRDEARWLGTELDLGTRYRLNIAGAELTVGVEGGVLLPGSALLDPEDLVVGGRAMLDAKL